MSSQISSPTPTPATDRRIWAVLAVAVATQTAGSFVSQGIYILVPFWREAFGISRIRVPCRDRYERCADRDDVHARPRHRYSR